MDGRLFDDQGRLALVPKGACHAMLVLHNAAGGLLGTFKTLAVFP